MGENEKEVTSVSFINLETGEEVCSFDTASVLNLEPNMSVSEELTYHIPSSLSFTLDNCEINQELWQKFIVGNPMNFTTEFYGYIPTLVQAKTHKKKRINKKWLKRYGMKIVNKKVHGKMLECRADIYHDRVELSSSSCILE